MSLPGNPRLSPIMRAILSGSFSEFTKILSEAKKVVHGRFPPTDEPLGWTADYKKLVRLDHAIIACHLMTARVTFRSLPALKRQRVVSLRIFVLNTVAGYLLKRLAGNALAAPRFVLNTIVANLRLNTMEDETELAIRRQMIRAMRDLRENVLFRKSHRRRKTSLVFTRRPGPPQRRANEDWKDPA